jgi:hypothetical protein
MTKMVDRTGQAFGYLTVVERGENASDGSVRWLCRCRCGNTCTVRADNLKSGNTVSCGCAASGARAEIRSTLVRDPEWQAVKHGHTSGHKPSPEWQSWRAMLDRCYRPTMVQYKNYGGRGITVCEQWRGKNGFVQFLADMGDRPRGKTLDRWPDMNGNYEPGNCRWATIKEQNSNRRALDTEAQARRRAALDAGRTKMWADPETRARLLADRASRPHKPNGDFARKDTG